MPELKTVVVIAPKDAVEPPLPPAELVAFTCPWAMDGLRRATEGMGTATAGVDEYHIGTRGLKYSDSAKQIGAIGWWNEMVKLFCGVEGLPPAATGRDTAFRVIMRDV